MYFTKSAKLVGNRFIKGRGVKDMEELLKEIIEGKKEYEINQKRPYSEQIARGKGTKLYLTKRIDLLRERLLDIKKNLK
jgi:hypothetical protein